MANPDPAFGLIIGTSAACKIKGRSWADIPTLVSPEGIDEAASDWLRNLVVNQGISISSAHEYANVIRPFLRFCRQQGRTWQSVDDDFLMPGAD